MRDMLNPQFDIRQVEFGDNASISIIFLDDGYHLLTLKENGKRLVTRLSASMVNILRMEFWRLAGGSQDHAAADLNLPIRA